jgi:hypothetical protein
MSLKSVQGNELRENLVINMRVFKLPPSLEDGTDLLARNLGKELLNYPEEGSHVLVVNSFLNVNIFGRVSALHIKSVNMLAVRCFCLVFFFS